MPASIRKVLYLPKHPLERLYLRFALADPKATRVVAGTECQDDWRRRLRGVVPLLPRCADYCRTL
jgi:hypothetical protein